MTTTSHRTVRTTTALAAAVGLLAVGGAAQAGQDAGPPLSTHVTGHCTIARVGTQYVCGDDLTGNDVPAPLWIPRR